MSDIAIIDEAQDVDSDEFYGAILPILPEEAYFIYDDEGNKIGDWRDPFPNE